MIFKQIIKPHLKNNIWRYLLLIAIFAAGIALGNFKSGGLGDETKTYLLNLLNQFFESGVSLREGNSLFWPTVFSHIKLIGLIWILGLTVIGAPLILGLIFARAFSLGFTIGFLIRNKGHLGVIITLISVIPQNLFYIPFLIVAGVLSLKFTMFLVRGRFSGRAELWQNFIIYTLAMIVVLLFFLAGAIVEVYLAPWLLTVVLG